MAEERHVRAKRGHDGNDVLNLPLHGVLGGVFARASAAAIHGVDGEAARQNGGDEPERGVIGVVPCTRTSGGPAPSRQHPIEVPSAERIRSIPSSVMAGDSVPGAPYRFFGRSEMLCIEA
jgi:hypothetical protein